jgi:hypothetical protein
VPFFDPGHHRQVFVCEVEIKATLHNAGKSSDDPKPL